jgi:GMP synthase-like glutamine amidotransferase
MRLSIVQHHPLEGPGRIAEWAHRCGIALDLYDATQGALPAGSGPVVLLGGPASTLDPPRWMSTELAWLRLAVRSGRPLLGICLGAQLLAIAAGGSVRRMTTLETGWTPVDIEGIRRLDVLQWHEDAILPPPSARIDATSAQCVQMFSLGERRIGVQFHPEWDDASLRILHAGFDGCPLPEPGDEPRQSRVDRWFQTLMARWSSDWPAGAAAPSDRPANLT